VLLPCVRCRFRASAARVRQGPRAPPLRFSRRARCPPLPPSLLNSPAPAPTPPRAPFFFAPPSCHFSVTLCPLIRAPDSKARLYFDPRSGRVVRLGWRRVCRRPPDRQTGRRTGSCDSLPLLLLIQRRRRIRLPSERLSGERSRAAAALAADITTCACLKRTLRRRGAVQWVRSRRVTHRQCLRDSRRPRAA
jgi:hypothetical protein